MATNFGNVRNVDVRFSQVSKPMDAYKAALKRVDELEAKYEANPSSLTDLTAATVVLTGNTAYKVHVFQLTTNFATGVYNFNYIESAPNTESIVEVESIEVTPASKTIDLSEGETVQLVVAFTPANASSKDVTYVSSDPTKATVSATGLVTPVATGTTTITVTTRNGKTDTSAITVQE